MGFLKNVFKRNGYPVRTVDKRLKSQVSMKATEESDELKRTLSLPYVQGASERISRAAKKLGLQVRFRKGLNLGSLLSNTKLDVVPDMEKGGVIYKQECNDCELVYIGETGRRAIVRKKEHEKDVRELNDRSAIADHCHKHDHRVDFEKFSVIGREKSWSRRRVREGIEILKHKTFNRDSGIHIDKLWKRFLL